MREVIQSWLPDKKFILIHKATKDGFEPNNYHEWCDSMGPQLSVIISSEGYIFGGYIKTMVTSGGNYTETHTLDPSSFLFTITNPFAIPPTHYPLLPGNWKTLHNYSAHLHLGWGKVKKSHNNHNNEYKFQLLTLGSGSHMIWN